MEIFVITFVVMVLASLGMALGAVVRKRPIIAGCAGAAGLVDADAECEICGRAAGAAQEISTGAGAPSREGL